MPCSDMKRIQVGTFHIDLNELYSDGARSVKQVKQNFQFIVFQTLSKRSSSISELLRPNVCYKSFQTNFKTIYIQSKEVKPGDHCRQLIRVGFDSTYIHSFCQ